jgi:hypothetical protein
MRLRLFLVGSVAGAVLVTAVLGSRPAASASRMCRWRVFQVPAYRDATHHPGISGLAAASARTVWAAGWWTNPLDGLRHPATFLWNGRSWRLVPSPEFGAIAAFRRAAWLVGKHKGRAFSARWNGRAWRVIATPGGRSSYLASVAIVSARDVWAVGQGAVGPLALRWNGKAWTRAAGPDFGSTAGFYQSVARIPGTSGVWIFGQNGDTGAELAGRWSGSAWETYTLPMGGNGSAMTNTSLAADSAASAWIGISARENNGKYEPWLIHWDGSSWSQLSTPNPGGNGEVSGVSAGSRSNAWAVGSSILARNKVQPFLLHWDGTRWSTVALARHAGFPGSVSAVPGTGQIWTAGGTLDRYSC